MKILKLISVFLGAPIIFSGFILFNKVGSIQKTENQLVSFPCLTVMGEDITAVLDAENHRIIIGNNIFQFIKIKTDEYGETLFFKNNINTTSMALLNISTVDDFLENEAPVLNYVCKVIDGL